MPHLVVRRSDDATEAWNETHAFLATRPAEHNVILTLIQRRLEVPEPGRYWWVLDGGEVVGLAMQSPLTFSATTTPMPSPVVDALVATIADEVPELPGVNGEAATAAAFAGAWTEHRGTSARPADGQRLYRLGTLHPPTSIEGRVRRATATDGDLARTWFAAFRHETGAGPGADIGALVDHNIDGGHLWLWCVSGTPVSMAVLTAPVAHTSRVGYVYTPPEHRRHGYAGAIVAAVSESARADRATTDCILYTQLSNPTSNRVYRALGYQAIGEVLSYSFDPV
jgi:predicted GNAT family acetyltransferase